VERDGVVGIKITMGPLLSSFVAAVQASLSVLLVISYGAIAAKLGLLNSQHGKAISKICVKMFLPALLLVQIGSELHLGSANRYLIILLWAFVCHFISFLVGIFAHLVFGLPDWVTAALMFNNTTSYPLLLIQSLESTGILAGLAKDDEPTRAMIERAKSYFLVFATVSSCLTFAVGPRLIDTNMRRTPMMMMTRLSTKSTTLGILRILDMSDTPPGNLMKKPDSSTHTLAHAIKA
jgi:predicted permease